MYTFVFQCLIVDVCGLGSDDKAYISLGSANVLITVIFPVMLIYGVAIVSRQLQIDLVWVLNSFSKYLHYLYKNHSKSFCFARGPYKMFFLEKRNISIFQRSNP